MSNKKALDISGNGTREPSSQSEPYSVAFRRTHNWKQTKLAQLVNERKEISDGKCEVFSVSVHKGFVNQVEHLGRSFAASDTSRYNLVRPYDVVYTKSPTGEFPYGIVKQNLANSNVIVSPLYGVFVPASQSVGRFIAAYFESPARANRYLEPLIKKGAKNTMQISNDTFLSGSIPFPDSELELELIVTCISSIEEMIAAESQRLDRLKAHKKGLMQQLFPAEGETTPRLRFPEFAGRSEWKEVPLSKLGSLVSGLTYRPEDVRDSGLLVLRSSNIINGEIVLEDCVYVDPQIRGAELLLPSDILICVRNGSKALIGKSALIPHGMPECTHGAFMTVFRSPTPHFVFQLFQTPQYQKLVAADLGATINSINGAALLKYKFRVPSELEQKKIANLLSTVDAWISAHARRIDCLKRHKYGLMQQLFPSLDEVPA